MKTYRFQLYVSVPPEVFLHIQSPEVSELSVWNMEGKLIKRAGVPAGYSSYLLPAGVYVVKVGNGESVKIVIR